MESIATNKLFGRFGVSGFLLLAILSRIHTPAHAWGLMVPARRLSSRSSTQWRSPFYMAGESDATETTESKDDEISKLEAELKIARLEAELKKLKDEKAADDGETEASKPEPPVAAVETPPAPTPKTPFVAEDDDEEILEEASMDMFLSEGWKEARSNYDPKNTATQTRKAEEQSSVVGLATKVVGAILALVVFSQIPVGQEDLSKYSTIKSGPAKVTIDLGDTNRVKGQKIQYNDEE